MFATAIGGRALGVWLGVRILVTLFAGFQAGGPLGVMPAMGARTSFVIVVVTAAVIILDMRRRGEHLLWGNLAVPDAALYAAAVVSPLAAEIVLRVIA